MTLSPGVAKGFKIAIVKDRRAHGDKDQLVNRLRDALDAGRRCVGGGIAADHGDVAFVQPGNARGMETRRMRRYVPWSLGGTSSPAAGSQEHHVAAAHTNTGLGLP